MHTWQNILKHFSRKKGPCGKMHTAKKYFTDFSFFPGKGFFTYYHFLHLTTIFFIGKTAIFRTQFSSHTTVESCRNTVESCRTTIESCRTTIVFCWSTIESCWSTIESCWTTIESCWSTRSLVEAEESRNTRKMVGFFITWLLYNQNPSRSNMAQPYRLIVWI